MTKEELVTHMLNGLKEELHAAEGYMTMAESTKDRGNPELTRGVLAMAQDELSHAEFIMMTMREYDAPIPSECHDKFHMLEHKLEQSFQW